MDASMCIYIHDEQHTIHVYMCIYITDRMGRSLTADIQLRQPQGSRNHHHTQLQFDDCDTPPLYLLSVDR